MSQQKLRMLLDDCRKGNIPREMRTDRQTVNQNTLDPQRMMILDFLYCDIVQLLHSTSF